MCVDKFLCNKSYLTHREVRIKQLHGTLIFLLSDHEKAINSIYSSYFMSTHTCISYSLQNPA